MIELLVVVAIIAILLSILLPALGRAREQTKSLKCLANLKTLGQGVVIYSAEEQGRLPGPLHPAVYRNQGTRALTEGWAGIPPVSEQTAREQQQRYLTYKLRRVFSDSSEFGDSVADEVSKCPVAMGINPDENFARYTRNTPWSSYPTDYVLNNVGMNDPSHAGGVIDNTRVTDPTYYFGLSTYTAGDEDLEAKFPPKRIEQIKQQSREWMVADAWYRMRPNSGFLTLQQEGPYQYSWSGYAMPNFAPHFAGRTYSFSSKDDRESQSAQIRAGKKDGKTNTVYFDGHAVPVKSKTGYIAGFEMLYGFEGTVNPNPEFMTPVEEEQAPKLYWE